MNKLVLLVLICVCTVGCTTTRVPTSIVGTPFGPFSLPKDMELEIEDLEFVRQTNGVTKLTAKTIRSKSRNNPKVISASAMQDQVNWEGIRGVVKDAVETGIKAGKASQGLP